MRLLVGLVVGVLAAACRPAPPPLTDDDRAAIRAVTDSFVAHLSARRDSAAAELYTETAVLMPANGGAVEGRAAIRAWIQQFPPITEFSLSPLEIDGRGDLAYVRGTYAMTFAGSDGRPGASDHGKYVEVRRRQRDGRWLITLDIANSDVPLPER